MEPMRTPPFRRAAGSARISGGFGSSMGGRGGWAVSGQAGFAGIGAAFVSDCATASLDGFGAGFSTRRGGFNKGSRREAAGGSSTARPASDANPASFLRAGAPGASANRGSAERGGVKAGLLAAASCRGRGGGVMPSSPGLGSDTPDAFLEPDSTTGVGVDTGLRMAKAGGWRTASVSAKSTTDGGLAAFRPGLDSSAPGAGRGRDARGCGNAGVGSSGLEFDPRRGRAPASGNLARGLAGSDACASCQRRNRGCAGSKVGPGADSLRARREK